MFFKEFLIKEEVKILDVFKKISLLYGFNEKPGSGINVFNKKLIKYCILNAFTEENTKKNKNHIDFFYLSSGYLLSTSDDKEKQINRYFNKAIDIFYKLIIDIQKKLLNSKSETNNDVIKEAEKNVKST